MLYYHFSDSDFNSIKPMIGDNRHAGEDPGAINTPVVYLTTDSEQLFDPPKEFRYTVSIEENDPLL